MIRLAVRSTSVCQESTIPVQPTRYRCLVWYSAKFLLVKGALVGESAGGNTGPHPPLLDAYTKMLHDRCINA
jgi:hypothetical protein